MHLAAWVNRWPFADRAKSSGLGRRVVATYRARSKPERALWFYREAPLRENVVLYQAADGKGLFGNPRAIFDRLVADPAYRHLRHVWVVDDPSNVGRAVAEQLGGASRVSFVTYGSAAYFRALSTAGYLVNDTTFPAMWGKRPGQTYVNTWHGVPLKKMGYDLPRGYSALRNVLRNLVAADYLLSTGPEMTDLLYRQAFRLEGIYRGTVLEEGYPRVDRQLAVDAADVAAQLRRVGIDPAGREVVLFAPTWRGSGQTNVVDQAHEIVDIIDTVEKSLDPDRQVLLVRVHPFVHDIVADAPELVGRLVPKSVITSDLLAVTDHLVTDYSSIFFDFLPMRRPISFLVPDLEEYRADRGLYFQPEEWPGRVHLTAESLGRSLVLGAEPDDATDYAARREEWRSRFAPHDDGGAAARVVDAVFGGGSSERSLDGLPSAKTTVLLYAGGLGGNGITSSLLSLLSLIDHETYDVSILYQSSLRETALSVTDRVHPAVRHFPRVGAFVHSPEVMHVKDLYQDQGPDACEGNAHLFEDAMAEEWRRCLGDTHFDHVIDFSGYSTFWSVLLLQGSYDTSSIWVHNDLRAELDSYLGGLRDNGRYLQGIFAILDRFDQVVSATKELRDVTWTRLEGHVREDQLTWVTNTIDIDEVWRRARGVRDIVSRPWPQGERRLLVAEQEEPVVRDVQELALQHGWSSVAQAVSRLSLIHTYLSPDPAVTTFATMGRLSAEKNHARLLRAFAAVHRRNPKVELIIMGRGELRGALVAEARALGIRDQVRFTGHLSNPMPLLRECDCFVMSSTYEGQGLAILEALALGLPVVSTRFDVVTSVLPPGQGLVVEQDDDALADGMLAFFAGSVPHLPFDAPAYNRRALKEFRSVITPRALGVSPEPAAHASAR